MGGPRDHQQEGVRGVSRPEKSACLRRALPHHVRHVDSGAPALRACAASSGGLHRGLGERQRALPRRAVGASAHHREHRNCSRDHPDHGAGSPRAVDRLQNSSSARSSSSASSRCSGSPHCNRRLPARPQWGVAYTLAAIKHGTFLRGPGWIVGWGNGLILGYMMYRTGLVPRRVVVAGACRAGRCSSSTGTAIMFSGNHPSSTLRSLQGPLLHPRGRVGTLPRRLLHHLGFQARCPDPFRERRVDDSGRVSRMARDAAIDKCRAGPGFGTRL